MRIHAEETGEGPVILCLHGIGSSSRSFRDQLDGLSTKRRVIAWDAPGYAASADPPGPPGMDGYADVAAALLDRQEVDRAHVLGLSFGAVVAVRIALRHPDRVWSLILADSTPGAATDPARAEAMRQRGDELAAVGAETFAAERAPRLLSAAAGPELVDEVRRNMAASIRLPGYGWAAEAMAHADHRTDFAQIGMPTLVLCGSEDRVTPPAVSEAIAAAIPAARLAIVEGGGHLSNQERPERFNHLVETFLDEVEAASGTPGVATAAPRSRKEQR